MLGSEGGAAESALPAGAASAAGTPGGAAARPYGRILIFTLLEDRAADFDRLAEETAEQVRTGEPDTLVYVIHLVPNAPMQRIFYEIYRDRAAFDSHESQPYMQRFVAERRALVLATNMIELRLKYAKVAPLPSPQPAAAALLPAAAAAPQPGVPAAPPRGMPGPPGRSGPGRCPRLARSVPTSRGTTSPGTASPAITSSDMASPGTTRRAPTGSATTSGGLTSGRLHRPAVWRLAWRGSCFWAGRAVICATMPGP